MTAKDRLLGKPYASRGLALFSMIGGAVVMLLVLCLAVVAFRSARELGLAAVRHAVPVLARPSKPARAAAEGARVTITPL
ncbi:hypothetical protein ACFDTO_08270 [Microbacteriaceae bacterium 4G12]